MSVDDVMLETEDKMEKGLAHLAKEFRLVRTGRATPALVEKISVHAYGSEMNMKQCATISVPEARQLIIKPFDPGIIKDIEKAVLASELGVTPANDGKILRLQFPPLTEERRKKVAQEVKQNGEDAKVAIRNARRDGIKELEDLKKKKEITEDDLKKLKDDIQELVKSYEDKVSTEVQRKADEVMEI